MFEQPRAALLAAANEGPRTRREERDLECVWHEVGAAGHGKELLNRLLARDEQLLHRARMDGGLEKRGAGGGKTFEIAFEGAAFGVAGRVDDSIALGGMKLVEE